MYGQIPRPGQMHSVVPAQPAPTGDLYSLRHQLARDVKGAVALAEVILERTDIQRDSGFVQSASVTASDYRRRHLYLGKAGRVHDVRGLLDKSLDAVAPMFIYVPLHDCAAVEVVDGQGLAALFDDGL